MPRSALGIDPDRLRVSLGGGTVFFGCNGQGKLGSLGWVAFSKRSCLPCLRCPRQGQCLVSFINENEDFPKKMCARRIYQPNIKFKIGVV